MSYDLQVWSTIEPDWQEIADALHGWTVTGTGLLFQTGAWQIIIGPCSIAEEEDIPEEIVGLLPGIRYLTELNLEPIHAPESARSRLLKAARTIAKVCKGVVLDPQEATLATPRGVKRLSASKPTGRISVFSLGWWFNDSPLLHEGGLAELLHIMEQFLPEALPRRYGKYEPPQFRYNEEGKQSFIDFVSSEELFVVWYASYPVLNVHLGTKMGYGATRIGYRANTIDVDIDASVWPQPGWGIALERFWKRASALIRPFYGEVRVLKNYNLQRGRVYSDGVTETHPIRNGWWNGIPQPMGSAVVIDKTYGELWPRFSSMADEEEGLMFLSVEHWNSGESVSGIIGSVPKEIAQGSYAKPFTYPSVWPFDGPFAED
jgi:hypothetical protein